MRYTNKLAKLLEEAGYSITTKHTGGEYSDFISAPIGSGHNLCVIVWDNQIHVSASVGSPRDLSTIRRLYKVAKIFASFMKSYSVYKINDSTTFTLNRPSDLDRWGAKGLKKARAKQCTA